ncbi:HAT2 [Candida pseudojiufengensis]|uniref:HAT2 n=1 Tax=Candida pseudojiufengensis TaxID=497109 RepID=UPI002225102B|nr:HAT2 [Candida pseudojiufengensis]KAI5962286.1 HAT2 [Candida pseudojiufengensis]
MDANGESQELSIKDEYQLWRKNCRYMYEFVSETALTWPSLTIQWLPNHTTENGVINTKLLLGTHTSGNDSNYLKIAETQISAGGKANSRIKIIKKFENQEEICRARYMPQNPTIVGTINGAGGVDLYNIESDERGSFSHFQPHSDNGYGLSWNPITKGLLLTASDDKTVCVSDTNKENEQIFKKEGDDIFNDAKWHFFDNNIFASASEDEHLYIYDLRSPDKVSKFYSKNSKGINSVAFSPFSHNLLAIGNTNSNIGILDLRNLKLLHTMMGHTEGITSLEFSPHKDGILASGSQDRRLIVWDLFKIGEEQQQEDAEDGCPELFMMHAGHTAGVTDLSWCPFKEWTIGSVADDNIVHLWEINKSLINTEEADVDADFLE